MPPTPVPPVEPAPTRWSLPDPVAGPAELDDLVGVGADLEPGTLLKAYRSGLFPMPLPEAVQGVAHDLAPIGWWSPDPRGVLPLDQLKMSRSLRKSCRQFEIRVDSAFETVMEACADPSRPHGWIDDDITVAYLRLHDLGWAHSVEAWNRATGELAGGLYGVAINGLFAGESMFHHETDASKVALVGLVGLMQNHGYVLLDVQWRTDHLASLGVTDISRAQYLKLLETALTVDCDLLGPSSVDVLLSGDTPWAL